MVSVIALSLDHVDVSGSAAGAVAEPAALARVAGAICRLTANVSTVAAAYKDGMILLVAPELDAGPARQLAEALHAIVRKLRLPNPESVESDYLTASVAAITGRAKRGVERVKMLTQAITSVRQAAAAGGDRVVAQSAEGETLTHGRRISGVRRKSK